MGKIFAHGGARSLYLLVYLYLYPDQVGRAGLGKVRWVKSLRMVAPGVWPSGTRGPPTSQSCHAPTLLSSTVLYLYLYFICICPVFVSLFAHKTLSQAKAAMHTHC